MSLDTELKFAKTRQGRVLLHLAAYVKDHKLRWHAKGIWREVINHKTAGFAA